MKEKSQQNRRLGERVNKRGGVGGKRDEKRKGGREKRKGEKDRNTISIKL